MAVRIGPIDPIGLIFSILNKLMDKKILSVKEVEEILKSSLDSSLDENEKEKIIKKLFGNKKEDEKK